MNATHEQIQGRELSVQEAWREPIPEDFIGECTGFPERILSFRGWIPIGHHCRLHDWHYTILREMLGQWTEAQWDAFRAHADLILFLGIVKDLRKGFFFTWAAVQLAKAVYWTVRSKLGELAAMGKL
jgi:hypothetical protein